MCVYIDNIYRVCVCIYRENIVYRAIDMEREEKRNNYDICAYMGYIRNFPSSVCREVPETMTFLYQ